MNAVMGFMDGPRLSRASVRGFSGHSRAGGRLAPGPTSPAARGWRRAAPHSSGGVPGVYRITPNLLALGKMPKCFLSGSGVPRFRGSAVLVPRFRVPRCWVRRFHVRTPNAHLRAEPQTHGGAWKGVAGTSRNSEPGTGNPGTSTPEPRNPGISEPDPDKIDRYPCQQERSREHDPLPSPRPEESQP